MKSVLWLGNQETYEVVLEAKAKLTADMILAVQEEPENELLDVQGNVGIISIKGSLVEGAANWMRYYGVTGYDDIRAALVDAVRHQGVQAILLDIKSGGGDVAGCHELAQLIDRVNAIKPIITYTGATMASAALWLGCSVTKVYAAETAMVGSLGVLTVHAERSKQLEEDGIKVTVVRAGKDKALANPYEPLSEKGKEDLQNNANALYDVFLPWVASKRGMSSATAEAKFGQGTVFVGKQALAAGLVDELGTYEDAYAAAQKLAMQKASKQNTRSTPSTRAALDTNVAQVLTASATKTAGAGDNTPIQEGNNMKLSLTAEELTAMAAGISLSNQEPEEVATPVAEAPEEVATPVAEAPVDPVATLTAQVKDLSVQLSALTSASAAATASADAHKVAADSMLTIVRNSIKTMAIGLQDEVKADTLDFTQALAEHGRLSALFKSKFKVGGVAATNTVEEPKPTKAAVDPLYLYAVRSLSTETKGK